MRRSYIYITPQLRHRMWVETDVNMQPDSSDRLFITHADGTFSPIRSTRFVEHLPRPVLNRVVHAYMHQTLGMASLLHVFRAALVCEGFRAGDVMRGGTRRNPSTLG